MFRFRSPHNCAPAPGHRPQGRLFSAILLAAVFGGGAVAAEPAATPNSPAAASSSGAFVPPGDPLQRIGSISVGHPHHGFLLNGVQMPQGKWWTVADPEHAWGTDETVDSLMHCLERVATQFPDSPKAIIGALSARGGGPFPPHKSHRTGRDVDVYLYLTHRDPKRWYEPGTADNLDRPRNWALLRAIITETDVEMVLLDRSLQALLEEYALGIGEPPGWVQQIFHGAPGRSSIVKHVPGHTGHMHIRFFSPAAQRRGVDLYDKLVRQGHIQPPTRELEHEVGPGDNLIRLAHRYNVSVEAIQRLNGLDGTVIKVGQKLKVRERVDLRGARDPVVIPPRLLPPAAPATEVRAPRPTSSDAAQTHAAG